MLTAQQAYEKYRINKGLQEHMLRVATVAQTICDSLTVEVPAQHIISACLLHDMGNIIKMNMETMPELLEPEGIDYWRAVQEEFFATYGHDEHEATVTIAKEIKVSSDTVDHIEHIGLDNIHKIKDTDLSYMIPTYSDMRVMPNGAASLESRMHNLFERQRNHPTRDFDSQKASTQFARMQEIEHIIFSHSTTTPDTITRESIESAIDSLREYELI